MSRLEFNAECVRRCILPGIAVENEKIRAALIARDNLKVIELLESEF